MLSASNAHAIVTRSYDPAHRQLTETQTLSGLAGTRAFSYAYDDDGNLHRHTRPDGSEWGQSTRINQIPNFPISLNASTRTYDALNRPVTDKDGANRTITSAYDAVGRKTSYTDAKQATFSFQFDALGRLTRRTEPDTTYQTYSYDAANRLLVHRKADSATKTHHYENADRDFLTKITYSNGETPRTFTYDADGQMLSASNAHAIVTRSYDLAHRQLTETQTLSGLAGTRAFSYAYDDDGNLHRHIRPDGSVIDYEWNKRNLLSKITSDTPPPVASYTYNRRDQIAATVVENDIFTATRSYDGAGRLTGVTNGTLDTTAYVLTADGRRDTATRNGSIDDYGYDNARQVTSAAIPLTGGTHTNSYAYDLAGNRSSAATNGATTTYLANLVNEYTTITGAPAPPLYDDNGNAVSYPVKPLGSGSLVSGVLSWDINNQQISATVGPDSATYQYDALGRRTQRRETIAGVTTDTWFLTNGWNVELEHDGSDYTKRQTWGLDLSNTLQGAGGVGGLVMVETLPAGGAAPVPHFPTYDGNGNITAWVNASGTVIARQRYDAYGNIIEQTGTAPSNYGFSTKPIERVTGLLYYGYRYYDPVTGRWSSRDPIEEDGGVNLYVFVENAGLNGWDFLGKISLFDDIGGNGGGGLIFPPIMEDDPDIHFPEDPNFKYLGTCNYRCTLIGDGQGSTCPYRCSRTGGSATEYCPPNLDSSNTKNPLTADQCEGECEKSFTYKEEVFGHPDNKWPNKSNN